MADPQLRKITAIFSAIGLIMPHSYQDTNMLTHANWSDKLTVWQSQRFHEQDGALSKLSAVQRTLILTLCPLSGRDTLRVGLGFDPSMDWIGFDWVGRLW